MIVIYNGKQYIVKKFNDNEWQMMLVLVLWEKLVLNCWQMNLVGFLEQVEVKV